MPHLIVSLKDREIGRYPVEVYTRVGRDPDLEVVIDNVGVSRHHATLSFDGSTTQLKDENSSNGVFVNGRRVATAELSDGDVIQIGKFSLNFSSQPLQAGMQHEGPASLSRTGGRSRDMQKTFALAPDDVQRLLAARPGPGLAQTQPQAALEEESGIDPAVKILGGGLALIALLGTVVFLLL